MPTGPGDGAQVGGEPPPVRRNLEPGEVSLSQVLGVVYRHRRLVLWCTLVGSMLGLLRASLAPFEYRAETKIVPTAFLTPASDLLGNPQLRAAASQLRLNVATVAQDPSPLFPQLLASRDLLQRLLDREYPLRNGKTVTLVQQFQLPCDRPEPCLQMAAAAMRGRLRSAYDLKSGVTTITSRFRDPELASAVANAAAEELGQFILELRTSQAGEKTRFIGQRLVDVQVRLAQSEDSLEAFRAGNRQIMGSPQLMLRESRLVRNVTVNEQLFLTLKTQHEVARLDQLRDLPDIAVIEKARPPLKRDSPKRRQMVLISVVLSGFVSLLVPFGVDFVKGLRSASAMRASRS